MRHHRIRRARLGDSVTDTGGSAAILTLSYPSVKPWSAGSSPPRRRASGEIDAEIVGLHAGYAVSAGVVRLELPALF